MHNKHYAFRNGENRRNLLSKKAVRSATPGGYSKLFYLYCLSANDNSLYTFQKVNCPFHSVFYICKYYTMAFIFCKGFFYDTECYRFRPFPQFLYGDGSGRYFCCRVLRAAERKKKGTG